jgi:xanthine dehydrogenase accessory factor
MKKNTPWNLVARSLDEGIPVMLLYVLESSGSSPGRHGFFMAVNSIGDMEGSIGGGIMEHKFVEMARDQLRAGSPEPGEASIKKQFHDKSSAKNQSGMICSGEQTILLYRVNENEAAPVQDIIISLEQDKNGTLVLSPDGIQFTNDIPANDFEFEFQSEDNWLYKEKTGYRNQLFIIGGGHCALALSKLMRSMDFYIRIYDERKDLRTMTGNDAAHEKYIVNDYAALKEMIPPGSHHYVVIMTTGYRTDDIALKALLEKELKYVGLLGSKKKVEKMFNDYRQEGISEKRLQRIHTPAGLAIKSQTPEEIAVSIAAEIIKVKNRDAK